MATYLSLCQQVHRLIRAGQNQPGSLPATVVGQTDPLLQDIVYFVNEAWQQLQNTSPAWIFMRNSTVLTLPINTSSTSNQQLTLATIRATAPLWRNIQIFNAAQYNYALVQDPGQVPQIAQLPIYFIPWNEFRGFYDRAPRQSGQPIRFSEDPDFNLWFDPPPLNAPSNPATAYQMVCDYRQTNQVLSADADIPLMPPDYQDILVYWAGVLYCQNRTNTSQLQQNCEGNVSRLLASLQSFQIPTWVIDDRFA